MRDGPVKHFDDAGALRAMAALRRRYLDRLPAIMDGLRSDLSALRAPAASADAAQTLHRSLHSLTGTAGTMGMKALSAQARQLEQTVQALVKNFSVDGVAALVPEWARQIDMLDVLAQREAAALLTAAAVEQEAARTQETETSEADAQQERAPLRDPEQVVCVVVEAMGDADDLCIGLQERGYRARQTTLAAVAASSGPLLADQQAGAVVVLASLPDELARRSGCIARLAGPDTRSRRPLVVALDDDDLGVRLALAHAGVTRTLPKPVAVGALADLLDSLTGRARQAPYRVLLVDDDPMQLAVQAAVLRHAGMEVLTLERPLEAPGVLKSFKPDVLVLDVYMPGATGPELAAALREREEHLYLPILFLSAETDMTQQLLALNLGGDDFLVKPVRRDHLIAAVSARAKRARQSAALRQRLQTTLYEREREHQALGEHANVSVLDATGIITDANEHFCRTSGFERDELIGSRFSLMRSDLHDAAFYDQILEQVTAGGVWHGEMTSQRKDGSLYWVETTITPFMDARGQVYQYVVIQTDISHIKDAESALRQSEARLNFLVSSSPVTIYTRPVQRMAELAYVSPNLPQITGWTQKAMTGQPDFWLTLVHPDDRARVEAELPLVLHQGSHLMEFRLRRPDGSHLWMHDQRLLVRDAQGTPQEVIGYWMDITERKRIEDELQRFNQELEQRVADQLHSVIESERLARATLDAMSAGVLILDEFGVVLEVNRAWCAMDVRAQVREGVDYVNWCERATADANDRLAPLAAGVRAVLSGTERNFVFEYHRKVDRETYWYVCRVERFPGVDEVRVVVSHEDVTDLKEMERQQLRSQRLESLGTLAGGVAHDFNNALAPVLMGMTLLKESFPQESRLIDMIQTSAQRGADMVRHLLTFARGADGEREPVNLERLMREIENLVKGSFPKNIELQVTIEDGLPAVVGDVTQLHQILLNLCVNARDAMPDGGVLRLGASNLLLDEAGARTIPDARPGRYVLLSVADDGMGIAPEILDRIFDPFFTTKRADKGTGLGLSTVLGIAKSHGGFVQVYSQPGEGSVFSVYLPAALSQDPAAEGSAATDPAFRGRGETVLLVDDEASVREVGRMVLEHLKFQPVVAVDGRDGLAQVARHRDDLKAVITDLHMPHMDGLAFVKALREILPEVPVVLASGRVDEQTLEAFRDLGVTRRLDKPFTEARLAQALRLVLPH